MTTDEMASLFTDSHLTLRAIAEQAGISHVAVAKRLHKAGVSIADGTRPTLTCAVCGATYRRKRSIAKAAATHYCSMDCYMRRVTSTTYRPWRYGQKLARRVAAQHFPLERQHVVHHHDGNNANNDPSNLAVFASHADHMRHHRGGHATPLWNGQIASGSLPQPHAG